MYYILFHYTEGLRAKDFYASRTEEGVIEFLHKNYKGIEVIHIIEAKRIHHLGLVVTADYVKSELEPAEETENLVPIEVVDNAKAILREKKRKLKELETEEPSAMSKIGDDIEKEIEEEAEMTPEQRTQKSLDDADDLIAREEKREEQRKKGWPLCIKCNSNRTAPHNKKRICTECQKSSEGKRPYKKRELPL